MALDADLGGARLPSVPRTRSVGDRPPTARNGLMARVLPIVAWILGFVACGGCQGDVSIAPQQQILHKGDATDYGLAGTWVCKPEPRSAFDTSNEPLTIVRGDDGIYEVTCPSLARHKPRFRVARLLDGHDHLFVEVEYNVGEEEVHRFLAIVLPQEDRLHYWPLVSTNFAKCMAEDGHEYHSQAGILCLHVQSDPQELLSTIRQHSRDLVGPVTTLRRFEDNSATDAVPGESTQ